jgi:hypothetical protein
MAHVLSLQHIHQVAPLALLDNQGLLVGQDNPALQDHQKSPDLQNQVGKAVGQPIATNRFSPTISDMPNQCIKFVSAQMGLHWTALSGRRLCRRYK